MRGRARTRGAGPVAVTVRAAVSLILGGVGFVAAERLLEARVLTGPNNLLYLTLLGLLLGYLLSAPLATRMEQRVQRLARRIASIEPETVLAGGAGATVALVITVLLNNVLATVPGFTWYWSLLAAVLLVTASAWFFVANPWLLGIARDASPARPVLGPHRPKLLDTSAIIDGRLVEVAEANFLEGRILVPAFVLGELQAIADDADPLRRKRGRRGLDVLERLRDLEELTTEVIHDEVAGDTPVDDKLIRLASRRGADLVTTDYNLHQVAQFQGVRVLNLHRLASAVKPEYLPGERLDLSVTKTGREPGQGLAYLEDGTMVVVEEAADRVGREVHAVVTSSLQTNVGRMIFARLADEAS